ncbi:hypothetical protein DW322_02995 [Rhodococcus rhodnii]|uniref:DUF4386 family protein n=1 Tax=Rhodococcus rhodnii TaxID=38312 RepID=A0A6P2CI92_9NOCA|nr:hypothetical protein DW322_02995 [Rhodococcus rhodnii]
MPGDSPEQSTAARPDTRTRSGRAWAYCGVVAGVAGIAGIQASMGISATYDPDSAGDAVAIMTVLEGQRTALVVTHILLSVCAIAMLVFAAGLARRLAARLPAGSAAPGTAAFGLVLTSATCVLGTGLTTEVVYGLGSGELVPEFAVFVGHWVATIPWLWIGTGLTGLAVAAAAPRSGAAPRWIGWVAGLLGALTLLVGLSPLQYLAGFVGPLLLLVLAIGFAFGDRAHA